MVALNNHRLARPVEALGNPEDPRETDPDAAQTTAIALWRGLLFEMQNFSVELAGEVDVRQAGIWNITNISGTISLPTGAATAAAQATGNASLASIDTKLSGTLTVAAHAVTQSGTWNIGNITGTISLPTGASTAALQTTGNTSLASIDTKLTTVIGHVDGLEALLAGTLTVGTHAVTQSGAWTVAATQSGTWTVTQSGTWNIATVTTVTTVAAVTAISNALPAGTNLLGKVGIDQTTHGTTNAVAVAGNQVTLTDKSGTITTGGTAQTAMASNASRRGFEVQNLSTGDLWISTLATAVQNQPSMKIAPGQLYETPAHRVSTGAVSIIGATTGQAFYGREW